MHFELAWGEEYTGRGKPPGGGRWFTAQVAIARHDDDDLLLLILLECKDGLTMKLHAIERSLHDVSVENFGGIVSLTGPAFHVPFHTKDPQKLELSHAFIKTLNAAKEGRVVASHVPRAAALKQALADEHQRKTELLKKQKRAGGLPVFGKHDLVPKEGTAAHKLKMAKAQEAAAAAADKPSAEA